VSAIATFKPIVISDIAESALRDLLSCHPYRNFPVVIDGQLKGVATRREVEAAIADHRPVKVETVPSCRPGDTIRDSQDLLIESPTQTLVLSDKPGGNPLAIVTLHDILRAQVSMSDREG
jgi:CIC family chloride channel protein